MKGRGAGASSGAIAVALAIAGAARADAGFDVAVGRFEITGASPFVDEFDDGRRDVAPTVRFVDRGASVTTESDGALRLADGDGADAALSGDVTVLDRLLGPTGTGATAHVTLASGLPDEYGERAGVLLLDPDAAPGSVAAALYVMRAEPRWMLVVERPNAFSPVVYRMMPAGVWPAGCGEPNDRIVVLAIGGAVACDPLPAGASPIVLSLGVDAANGDYLAAYRLGDESAPIERASWRVPGATPAFGGGAVHPALFARGRSSDLATFTDFAGVAAPDDLERGPGGALLATSGAVAASRVASIHEEVPAADEGSFSLRSADAHDLREAPGSFELSTPRGSLRATGMRVNPLAPRDPSSGRPLRPDSPAEATCATGSEPDCLPPYPIGPRARSVLDGAVEIPEEAGWTPEQRSLLGCGPHFGTSCGSGGAVDLAAIPVVPDTPELAGEASVVFQSWPPTAGWQHSTTDDSRPQPGTIGFVGGPVCTRVVRGNAQALPGCPLPNPPNYDPEIEGDVIDLPFPFGQFGIPAQGSGTQGAGPFEFYNHPYTLQPWANDFAALSWNLLVTYAALSQDVTSASGPVDAFDPLDAYRTGACSYVEPFRCRAVRALRARAVENLPDDPGGAPALRWVWESGARYRITDATGDFAALRGGTIDVPGPAKTTIPGAAALVPILTSRARPADADEDGVRDANDRCATRVNPFQEDGDGDRVGDACDRCILQADAAQRDTDGDGYGNRCDADLNDDGRVNFADLAMFKRRLYTVDPHADFDGDGRVNLRDAAILKQAMFRAPGPSAP